MEKGVLSEYLPFSVVLNADLACSLTLSLTLIFELHRAQAGFFTGAGGFALAYPSTGAIRMILVKPGV
jgi:hypothetical protein